MKVTSDQFNRFFNSKKTGTYKCPVCSNETFFLAGGGGEADAELALFRLSAPIVRGDHTFFALCCTNCGYATFFHYSLLEESLKKEQGEKKDG